MGAGRAREGADDHGGVQFLGPGHAGDQAGPGRRGDDPRYLALAGLGQQVASGGQPGRRLGGHPPQDVEAVRAAVERQARFVDPRLRGQQCDVPRSARTGRWRSGCRPGRAAWRAAGRRGRPGTPGRRRRRRCGGRTVPRPGRGRRRTVRPRRAPWPAPRPAHPSHSTGRRRRSGAARRGRRGRCDGVIDGGVVGRGGLFGIVVAGAGLAGESDGLADQELGATAGHEDPGAHSDSQAAELGPADHVLQRLAGGPPVHHGGQVGQRGRRRPEQAGLVLGEDAAGGPEPGDHDGFGKG